MKWLCLGIFMIANVLSSYAKSYEKNCFGHHIKESIKINMNRRSIYNELTNGRSNKVFTELLNGEHISLIPALFFDLRARPYQKKGIPLFCYEFMSMNAAPEFDPNNRIYPQEEFEEFGWKSYKARLNYATKNRDLKAIKKISLEAIDELAAYPSYYCMLRHIFESIYRFAYFAPIQEKLALDKGLKSPMHLSLGMIKLQLLAVGSSYKIDKLSAPIQKDGIPLLCSELPQLLNDLDLTK